MICIPPALGPLNYRIKSKCKHLYQFLINFTLSISIRQIFEVLKQRRVKAKYLFNSRTTLMTLMKVRKPISGAWFAYMGRECFAHCVVITTLSRTMVKKHGMLSHIYDAEHRLSLDILERKYPCTER